MLCFVRTPIFKTYCSINQLGLMGAALDTEDNSSREKCGVMLQMSNAFMAPGLQRGNGIRTAQTVIAFEEWRWDRRKIGIYIAPMFIEGGGSTYPLSWNIDTIIVDLRGL